MIKITVQAETTETYNEVTITEVVYENADDNYWGNADRRELIAGALRKAADDLIRCADGHTRHCQRVKYDFTRDTWP